MHLGSLNSRLEPDVSQHFNTEPGEFPVLHAQNNFFQELPLDEWTMMHCGIALGIQSKTKPSFWTSCFDLKHNADPTQIQGFELWMLSLD